VEDTVSCIHRAFAMVVSLRSAMLGMVGMVGVVKGQQASCDSAQFGAVAMVVNDLCCEVTMMRCVATPRHATPLSVM
jgi:hypothetical protein